MINNNPEYDDSVYPIIGMSPGNSFFKDEKVQYILQRTVDRFGRAGILIADIPAISTYIALGYSKNRARRDKAIPKGNALKNRVFRAMKQCGYTNNVKIFDWKTEVENNCFYQQTYKEILNLYNSNKEFNKIALLTTQKVLEGSNKQIKDITKASGIAVHYLLSELAFLEFVYLYIGVKKIVYLYHKNWKVYEDYILGKFDGIIKTHMDFLLFEYPNNL